MSAKPASEHQIQSAFIKRVRMNEKKYPMLKMLFAIPSGGARTAITGAMLKREGVIKGVPDLFLAYPSQGLHGLFIEFKAARGVLSSEQREMINALEDNLYACVVCRDAGEAWEQVMEYLDQPLRDSEGRLIIAPEQDE
jgi:hypothetical protein